MRNTLRHVFRGLTAVVMACSGSDSTSRDARDPLAPSGDPPARFGAFLWGMVVDESGVCIAGATATVVRGQGVGRSIQQKTPCDAWGYGGGFEFWDLTPRVEMTIRASAEGYAARDMTVFPVSPGSSFQYAVFALSPIR